MTATIMFCRSRNDARRCTRERDHRGLHRHRTLMWMDAGADEPRCPGSGASGSAAATLANGFPDGRALCAACLRFIDVEDGRLAAHDTSAEDDADRDRAEWFNTFGWADS